MMKDYLSYENNRNKRNADLYTRLIKAALAKSDHPGEVQVLIGHHLTFEINGELETENEISSADCLMFDHDIMTAVFGDRAIPIMRELASTHCDRRDALLSAYFDTHQSLKEAAKAE